MKNPLKKIKLGKLPSFKKLLLNKKFITATAIVMVICVVAGLAFGTVKSKTYYKMSLDNLAEARYYLKQAQSDTIRVQFFSGVREEPYTTDGKVGKAIPFSIINVDPKGGLLKDRMELKGSLRIGDEVMEVTLDKNPYDRNFACDLGKKVDASKEVRLTLFLTDKETPTFTLADTMPEGSITWEDALRTASDELAPKVKDQKFEVYVKIVSDLTQEAHAFWYVQFITEEGKTHFCVIAPDGGLISRP